MLAHTVIATCAILVPALMGIWVVSTTIDFIADVVHVIKS